MWSRRNLARRAPGSRAAGIAKASSASGRYGGFAAQRTAELAASTRRSRPRTVPSGPQASFATVETSTKAAASEVTSAEQEPRRARAIGVRAIIAASQAKADSRRTAKAIVRTPKTRFAKRAR